jgi:hypothetical protein
MTQRGDIGKDPGSNVMERAHGHCRRSDAGDDDSMAYQAGEIILEAWLTDDKVGAVRHSLGAGLSLGGFDLRQPLIELLDVARVRRRECSDDAAESRPLLIGSLERFAFHALSKKSYS